MQYLAAGVLSSHQRELFCTVQSDRYMAKISKCHQVSAGTATQVENRMRCRFGKMAEQGGDILTYVMAAGALPKGLSAIVVVAQRELEFKNAYS